MLHCSILAAEYYKFRGEEVEGDGKVFIQDVDTLDL